MNASKEGTLQVPGASLYYKVRGDGPVLLILQGGAGDAEGSNSVADHLADRYTVLTYDRRGLSRSKVDDSGEALRLETHTEDVRHLLAALTSERVSVFGSSFGALMGLDLVARHPELVRVLVAHEPPAAELLTGAERARAERTHEHVEETYRREGGAAAMREFAVIAALNFNDREPDAEWPRPNSRMVLAHAANAEFFLKHDIGAVRQYKINMATLKAASTRIVPAGGRTSTDTWPHHCASALADRLGTEFVEFPGGHVGYLSHPRAFAAKLREVLGGPPDTDLLRSPVHLRKPEDFDGFYRGTPPWDIGRPQPTFRMLSEEGALRGRVLDIGCGTGEHTLLAASLGLDATGIDTSEAAIAIAEGKARDRGLPARCMVWNALQLASLGEQFDTVLDCGLFHVLDDNERRSLVDNLRAVIRPQGRYFMLCFSEHQPGDFGPRRVTQHEIRTSFNEGWLVDSIEPSKIEITIGTNGIFAWLARITRT